MQIKGCSQEWPYASSRPLGESGLVMFMCVFHMRVSGLVMFMCVFLELKSKQHITYIIT